MSECVYKCTFCCTRLLNVTVCHRQGWQARWCTARGSTLLFVVTEHSTGRQNGSSTATGVNWQLVIPVSDTTTTNSTPITWVTKSPFTIRVKGHTRWPQVTCLYWSYVTRSLRFLPLSEWMCLCVSVCTSVYVCVCVYCVPFIGFTLRGETWWLVVGCAEDEFKSS